MVLLSESIMRIYKCLSKPLGTESEGSVVPINGAAWSAMCGKGLCYFDCNIFYFG